MTVTRADVVAEARSWIGTPFMHQQSRKTVGVDCIGLARGVCRELGIKASAEKISQAGQRFHGYSRQPDGILFREFCDLFMVPVPIECAQPGDVILMRFTAGRPQHSAVLGDYVHGGLSMIHALGPDHPSKVVEHRIDKTWRERIVAAYRLPGVSDA